MALQDVGTYRSQDIEKPRNKTRRKSHETLTATYIMKKPAGIIEYYDPRFFFPINPPEIKKIQIKKQINNI